ncbi:TPA: hypothetical protein EYO12_04290 [Candidatus Saccharibacteria bacterium]|nr:hypothetical protein [Candidatus Saccharibacteria bacterium]HIO87746.1 hypothetical protein [Candidatus Saccharibacteria bacterium]
MNEAFPVSPDNELTYTRDGFMAPIEFVNSSADTDLEVTLPGFAEFINQPTPLVDAAIEKISHSRSRVIERFKTRTLEDTELEDFEPFRVFNRASKLDPIDPEIATVIALAEDLDLRFKDFANQKYVPRNLRRGLEPERSWSGSNWPQNASITGEHWAVYVPKGQRERAWNSMQEVVTSTFMKRFHFRPQLDVLDENDEPTRVIFKASILPYAAWQGFPLYPETIQYQETGETEVVDKAKQTQEQIRQSLRTDFLFRGQPKEEVENYPRVLLTSALQNIHNTEGRDAILTEDKHITGEDGRVLRTLLGGIKKRRLGSGLYYRQACEFILARNIEPFTPEEVQERINTLK